MKLLTPHERIIRDVELGISGAAELQLISHPVFNKMVRKEGGILWPLRIVDTGSRKIPWAW